MQLNELKPSIGSRISKTRRRGGSTGKTCGRGHKGQKARSGGSVPARREGGQTPLYRRLPKFGFTSRKAMVHARLPLSVLNNIPDDLLQDVSIDLLKTLDLIPQSIKSVKIYLSGSETRKVVLLSDIKYTTGVAQVLSLPAEGSSE